MPGAWPILSGFVERVAPLSAFVDARSPLTPTPAQHREQLQSFFVEDESGGDDGVLLSADRPSEIHHTMQLNVKHRVWALQAKTPGPSEAGMSKTSCPISWSRPN